MILMCNEGIADSSVDQQRRHGSLFSMDGNSSPAGSTDDGGRRVKFLCSFSGSIMPRPQDGKLRYVGGDTRIVGVPRDITYDDLMAKMRDLYEGAVVLKYQQPDEDLDALVSVVNDEDVVNMMEEYDKLCCSSGDASGGGAGGGFTRLRIFLFSQPENDASSHYDGGGGDERETERRYVDALNSLNDSPPVTSPVGGAAEHYFNSMAMPVPPQYNLRRLSIPHVVNQRYSNNDVEGPWSPAAYYSPRPVTEFPSSPFGDFPEQQQQQQPPFEPQSQYPESVAAWNVFHGHNPGEGGSSICEHCRMAFHRNFDHPGGVGNGLHHHQVHNPCADCPPSRESYLYPNEQSLYNEALINERGGAWVLQQQLNASVSGSMRTNDHYPMSSNYLHHRAGYEMGNEAFHDQAMAGPPNIHAPSSEETGVRYGNIPFPYVGENIYPTHGHVVSGHPLWRNVQNSSHVGQSYEANSLTQGGSGRVNPGLPRSQWEGIQNSRAESTKLLPFEGKAMPEYSYGHASIVNSTNDLVRDPIPDMTSMTEEEKEPNQAEKQGTSDTHDVLSSEGKTVGDIEGDIFISESINSCSFKPAYEDPDASKHGETDYTVPEDPNLVEKLSFLPEMIASAKKAALDGANDMKAKVEEGTDEEKNGSRAQELANELESATAHVDTELDSDGDNINTSRIEPTKAEAEAFDKGLQTIMNDDLEEIRELGSGTYGAVFHGKWRGSDVAIKRIKASCFAGRPSERERLIADFWKEALILSSLHHPNVVSFYGIVRDGPDGTLATVTEFMVNGSLKQFLQKKDRTIDRRKRLIIAMDAAFGMEYLHGKNIVHFDLKCENLLVNMRDPQRPVCKIGDLGLSKVKQQTLVSGGVRGTLPWMAPELLSGKSNMVTEKIDVYSFGIVMWELLTGEEPYADLHCASIIGGIVNNTLRPQTPTWCDPEWKPLMESCWASEPAQRPSFSEISQKLRNMAAAMNLK